MCIVLTVFGLGLSATWQQATFLFRQPILLLRAVLSMSVVMPAIAAVIATQLSLPFEVQVALVALAMSPVPPIIRRSKSGAGGRMHYVVGLLVAMGLLAIVLVPLTVVIFDHVFDRSGMVDPAEIAKIIATTVLAPLLAGLVVRHGVPLPRRSRARSLLAPRNPPDHRGRDRPLRLVADHRQLPARTAPWSR